MIFNIFKGLVFLVFFIEIFIGFTLEELEGFINGERTKAEVGCNIMCGYIMRVYMAYALLRGLFM